MKKRTVPKRRTRRARPLLVAAGALVLAAGCQDDLGVPIYFADMGLPVQHDLTVPEPPPDQGPHD
jgi:hypothetical protein